MLKNMSLILESLFFKYVVRYCFYHCSLSRSARYQCHDAHHIISLFFHVKPSLVLPEKQFIEPVFNCQLTMNLNVVQYKSLSTVSSQIVSLHTHTHTRCFIVSATFPIPSLLPAWFVEEKAARTTSRATVAFCEHSVCTLTRVVLKLRSSSG